MDQAHPVDPQTYEAAVAWRHWALRHWDEIEYPASVVIQALHRMVETMADELGWPY